ncbi:TVP38/TMEM64 family protein [Paenibacillus sp. J31TS4]|uniref:TVP38/TMEM64 family protein n=1 Tax=Paenibacillus sp. J31TS4 TaxID=2807195 RepID=UPI001BD06B4D|nr:TVP38/TMEM64 family protein [Paenibacillus sp. J31TS4]
MKKSMKVMDGVKGLLAVIAVLLLVGWMIKGGLFRKISEVNVERISDYFLSFGPFAWLLGMAAVVIQTIVPFLPFVVIAGANVLVFGLYWGFLINYSMSIVGAILAFFLANFLGRDWVNRKLQHYPLIASFNDKLENHGFFYILVGRLIPIIPSSAINVAAGAGKVRFWHFLAATALGKLPIVLMECLIGHDLLHFKENKGRLFLLLLVFLGLLLVGNWIKKRMAKAK